MENTKVPPLAKSYTADRLIRSYIAARLTVIHEFYSDFVGEYKRLIVESKLYCMTLDVTWESDMLPESVWESLSDQDNRIGE